MQRKGEGWRQDRRCGVPEWWGCEDVKNEEVVINCHSSVFGDGQLWTILTVIRDNWEWWSSSLPSSWWEASQWSICTLFSILCLLCGACKSWWLLSFMQLCKIPTCGGVGELLVRGWCFLAEGGLAGRTDFFYFMSSSIASHTLTC